MGAQEISWGFAFLVTIMGISTVFLMLLVLIGVIALQNKLINGVTAKPVIDKPIATKDISTDKEDALEPNKVYAVIATAIHLHVKAKNSERFITIKRIVKSPWSVKGK